jgi:hypothetical protein
VKHEDLKRLQEILADIPREDALQSVNNGGGRYLVTVRVKKQELLMIKLAISVISIKKFRKRKPTKLKFGIL